MGATTLDEGLSTRVVNNTAGVAALNKRKRTKQRGEERRRMGRLFPFASRLLGTSSRSVPLTGEVRANPVRLSATRFIWCAGMVILASLALSAGY